MLHKIGIYLSKQKSYNIQVVGNGEKHLLVKGNLKRSTQCDEFDKIHQFVLRILIQNSGVRVDQTRNRSREWNLLVDAHIFHVCSISNRDTV